MKYIYIITLYGVRIVTENACYLSHLSVDQNGSRVADDNEEAISLIMIFKFGTISTEYNSKISHR